MIDTGRNKLTIEQVIKLADWHIAHYDEMIQRGGPDVRIHEARMYREIWLAAKIAVESGKPIPAPALSEIDEAIESGEFDVLLGFGGDS
jgi:hypothetical protein